MSSLILIPGLAADARMWQAQREGLAHWRPEVAEAHTGHATIEAMAAALLGAHAGELVLCGASMGGIIAMEAARQAPQRIKALALLGTNARPETDDMRALREAAITRFAQGQVREVIEPNVAMAFHPDHASDARLVATYLAFVLDAGAPLLIRQNRAIMARPDARTHLPLLRCPTLVMCGDADLLTPPECAQEIAALVPQAELVMLAGCGHMLTMEKPAEVNATLRTWLQKVA